MRRTLLYGLIALLVGALVWVSLLWDPVSRDGERMPGVASASTGGDFSLQSYAGQVTLQGLRGKVVLLSFGYTHCPDVCPTGLAFLAMALNELTEEELQQVQGLFVSIDPRRDTLERLKGYGEYFHPNILGVTGDPEAVAQVARQYGVVYRIVGDETSSDYVVDHSADTYVIDQEGRLYRTLQYGASGTKILALIRDLLGRNTS